MVSVVGLKWYYSQYIKSAGIAKFHEKYPLVSISNLHFLTGSTK